MNLDELKANLLKQIEEKEYQQTKLVNGFASAISKIHSSFSSLILSKDQQVKIAKESSLTLMAIADSAAVINAELSTMKNSLNLISEEDSDPTFLPDELVLIKSDVKTIYKVISSSKGECGTVRYLVGNINNDETQLVISKNLKLL